MKVSAGARGSTSDRQVCFTVTGINNNDYSRTANVSMNVPYSRMNETLRLVHRMGGRITDVSVSGGDLATPAKAPRKARPQAKD